MNSGKRIILLRHCEQPHQKKIEKIQSHVGGTNQGMIRTYLRPELINKLIGNETYELHTYTHTYKNEPTSRAYYTSQLLLHHTLYEKSDDINELVENVKKSICKNIIICWEHEELCIIMNNLIGIKPTWSYVAKKMYNELGKKFKVKDKVKIELKDVEHLKYCASDFIKQNTKTRDYYTKPDEEIEYALVWDIDYEKKEYKVYPDYMIKKCQKNKNKFKVLKYI